MYISVSKMTVWLIFLFSHTTDAATTDLPWKNVMYQEMQNITSVIGVFDTNYFVYEGTFDEDVLTKQHVFCLVMRMSDYYGYTVAYRKYKIYGSTKQFGMIAAIDESGTIEENFSGCQFENVIDATGCCVIPGLVDSHTHPVWAGDRVHEFAMKLAGASYLEIHAQGGGIHFTVDHTKDASAESLLDSLVDRLGCMLRSGTTLVEAKSGYGLDLESEVKLLRVIDEARARTLIEISSTYCGGHAVPRGKTVGEATEDIVRKQIPEIKRRMLEGTLNVENIDVFCEEGVFDVDSTRSILQAGRSLGLRLNFHSDELSCIGGTEPMVMYLACIICHMSLEEALAASTINGAAALGRSGTHGSIEVGKMADLVVVEAPSWEHLIYQFGCHDRTIKCVIKAGNVVHTRESS